MKKRLVVGVSGASGAPLAIELLRQLKHRPDVESHLHLPKGREMPLHQHTGLTTNRIKETGFSKVKTVAGIVSGYSDNLLLRAADCMLKERRKLVLVARESPLSTLHLENLCKASRYGAVILPPIQTYYNHPATVPHMPHLTVNRILSRFDLDEESYEWEGMTPSNILPMPRCS